MPRRPTSGEVPLTEREIGRHGAPNWVQPIVMELTSDLSPRPPSVDFVPVVFSDTFGGRYFPRKNAILVYETRSADKDSDFRLNVATLVHELGHWRSYMDRCGSPGGRSSCGYHGDHDATFYRIVAPMYRRINVQPEEIRIVEGTYDYPESLLTVSRRR